MKAISAVLLATLGLAACSPPPSSPEAKYPDEWLALSFDPESLKRGGFQDGWVIPPSRDPATDVLAVETIALVNLHETESADAGYVVTTDGEAFATRNIRRAMNTLSFVVPAFGVSYVAQREPDGSWSGDWSAPGGVVRVNLTPGAAPSADIQQLVTLPDGRQMHIVCSGEGSPVVLLDYGAGGTMKRDWGDIARLASEKAHTKVCAYDRAGRGLSDPAPTPRDTAAVADDIDAMLTAANLPPPYILVGHSLGSYHVRQFANTRADKTAGLVLVDPSGDGQLERFNAVIPKVQKMQDEMFKAQAELQCITRLREKPVAPDDPFAQQCGGNDPEALSATKSEIEEMPGASTQQLLASRRQYGAMPVIVLTRGDYDKDMPPDFTAEDRAAMKSVWEGLHAEMAALSTSGEQRHIPGAGHYIQRDNPEAVLTAIADVVEKVRQTP